MVVRNNYSHIKNADNCNTSVRNSEIRVTSEKKTRVAGYVTLKLHRAYKAIVSLLFSMPLKSS